MKSTVVTIPPEAIHARRMSGEDRRHQILEAAIERFSKHGFQGTTTKQISLDAGVNEAIIFRHFATKQDLYAAILDYKWKQAGKEQWIEEMRALADRNDDEGLFRCIIARILEAYRRDPQFQRLMFYAGLEGHEFARILHGRGQPFHKFLQDYIAKRQRAGVFRRCDPALLVFALISMPAHFGLVTKIFGADCFTASDDEAVAFFSRLLMEGIRREGQSPATNITIAKSKKVKPSYV